MMDYTAVIVTATTTLGAATAAWFTARRSKTEVRDKEESANRTDAIKILSDELAAARQQTRDAQAGELRERERGDAWQKQYYDLFLVAKQTVTEYKKVVLPAAGAGADGAEETRT
jgi:hypothetical protein